MRDQRSSESDVDARGARPEGLHPDLPTVAVWPGWIAATLGCLRFYSRLPLPSAAADAHGVPDFRVLPRALPFAALLIAAPAALLLVLAASAGLASGLAAGLAVAALVLITGAFHEDGLADSADGLFGGHTPERRLEIMKDSRIGSYGASALGLSLLLRAAALAAILDAAGGIAAAMAVLAAAAWSRAEGVWLLATQPPARSGGAAAAVGRPSPGTAWLTLGLSGVIGAGLLSAAGVPLWGAALGAALAHGASLQLARTAQRLIGGQTGDIAGAVQQLAEIAIYLGLALALGRGA